MLLKTIEERANFKMQNEDSLIEGEQQILRFVYCVCKRPMWRPEYFAPNSRSDSRKFSDLACLDSCSLQYVRTRIDVMFEIQ